MFQEFQLSVTPVGNNQYLIRTEKVAAGVPIAEEQVSWPVEEWLEKAQKLMSDPMLSFLEGNNTLQDDFLFITGEEKFNPEQSAPLGSLVNFGQELYEALFQGTLRDSWIAAQSVAHSQRSILRLRLGLKANNIARLPWEVLHSRETKTVAFSPLASGTEVAFSRYQPRGVIKSPQGMLKPGQPLRILMAISEPDDQESLELQEEARQLQQELERNAQAGLPKIELTLLEQPGRAELTQALEQGNYQVFHYAGHSNLGQSGGDVYLVSRNTGLTERLYGEDLAGLLVNNGIQLAVFNSCRSAATAFESEEGGKNNLAQALVKRGIPAVLAMAERIPDEVALTLTRLLYRNIEQGYAIDLSLSRARQGLIGTYGSNQLYWALPVLYLHPEFDGVLIPPEPGQPEPDPFDFYDLDDIALGAITNQSPFSESSNWIEDELSEEFNEGEEKTALRAGQWGGDEKNSNGRMAEDTGEFIDDEAFVKQVLGELTSKAEEPEKGKESFVSLSPSVKESQEEKDKSFPEKGTLEKGEKSSPEIGEKSPQGVAIPEKGTKNKSKSAWSQKLGLVVGVMGLIVVSLGGLWFIQQRGSKPDDILAKIETGQETIDLEKVDLKEVNNESLTAFAIEKFNEGELALGALGVSELLDRGALPLGSSVLAGVKPELLDEAKISFLRGRLAWQWIISGNENYSIDDVRRYWETAVKKEPENVVYQNALGFAYYEEGQIERANQAWYNALDTAEKQGNIKGIEKNQIYAGLALGMQELASARSGSQQNTLLNKARQLRQQVLSEEPINFQEEGLAKNWLWSEKAIKDWQNLGKRQ